MIIIIIINCNNSYNYYNRIMITIKNNNSHYNDTDLSNISKCLAHYCVFCGYNNN